MSSSRFLPAFVSLVALGQSTTPDVGSGAPNVQIQQQFQAAFYRGGFAYQVSLPPLADVKRLGTNGLVQEFSDAAKSTGVKLALVMPNVSTQVVEGNTSVFQLQAGLYAYFTQVGVSTAGMPTTDTLNCPSLRIANTCQYQLFDKPYALFVFKNSVNNTATNFATRNPFYARWLALGGIATLGPAESAETAVTSLAATKATVQYFDQGAIYNITSGPNTGRLIGVRGAIYTLFNANNSDQGFLGIPTSDELVLANGHVRQSFEGGAIEYDPANPSSPPVLRNPVASITVSAGAAPIRLQLGDTFALQAALFDPNGAPLTDRALLWTTSNGRIIALQPAGSSVTVKAVGGGTATVTASSEGKTSTVVTFIVTAPCCQIGEGAPTPAVAQAFQDAVTRNRLTIRLPVAASVVRAGSGYIQQLESTAGVDYLAAVSDRTLTAFLISGNLLAQYLALGGPAGTLGYPVSDANAAGRQLFENGALAGNPPIVVSGDILSKWALLGYETGLAGNPAGPQTAALTFRATPVQSQPFQNALLVAVGRPAKVYAVSGPILTQYLGSGGPAGRLGAPTGDETAFNGKRRQDFEGGFIDYTPGDAQARVTEAPRQPLVNATPASVLAGTPVRLSLGGFDDNATVRVSITGQPDFTVTAENGAYVWESYVPSASKSAVVTVRAVDVSNPARSAQAIYNVRALADARLHLAVLGGNNQSGAPGGVLAAPLIVVLTDEAGNTVAGAPVQFIASPGAAIESAAAVTDENGQARATVRLPSAGIALINVQAGGQEITLSARTAAVQIANFPALTQAVPGTLADGSDTIAGKGGLLTAAASIVRYYQLRGDAPSPAGLADPQSLNQFLKSLCAPDSQGVPVCNGFVRVGDSPDAIVNLWRVPAFTGGALGVVTSLPLVSSIRDRLAQGTPVLVALTGARFVVATGIGADGQILIADPDPASAHTTLEQYLVEGASISGVAVFLPGPARAGGFEIAANATIDITSASGSCGAAFQAGSANLVYCDGAAPLYEVDLSGPSYRGALTTLEPVPARYELSGGGKTTLGVQRQGDSWIVGPLTASIAAGGVLNAATFTADIASGGLVSIFGAGFGRDPQAVSVDFNGVPAVVVAAFPFQLNVQVPPGLPPGPATVHVTSGGGTAELPVTISPLAPVLFTLGGQQGAVINRDGSINGPTNPARRGDYIVAFGTGLGAVVASGGVMRTSATVTATIGGVNVPVLFAGLSPAFTGLYQVNISLPAGIAPGLNVPLVIREGSVTANTVLVSVQ